QCRPGRTTVRRSARRTRGRPAGRFLSPDAAQADARFGRRMASRLRNRDFRLLWAGQTISRAGTEVSVLALPLIAIQILDATTFEVGSLTAIETLPFLLVGLPAGAWVDRMRRRRVLIVADVGRLVALG